MGQKDIVAQILAHIPTIDWSRSSTPVSLFETTIRYMGGMLSGYDLLSGPLAHLADDAAHVEALLRQSVHLANNLSFAFDTPSGVPYNLLDLSTGQALDEPTGLATAGTLILEWTRLSDLTGDPVYAALVARAEAHLLAPKPASAEPYPGLLGMKLDPVSGRFLDAFGGWIGGADSFYEYLLKMWIYDPARFGALKDRYILAADSTMTFLASRPLTRPDLLFVAAFNGTRKFLTSSHLACFHGGNFILAGQTLRVQRYLDFGLALVDGCRATYAASATQIGPEVFGWNPASVPRDQEDFFARNGFYILAPGYQLRPEVIESYYYAFCATGDVKYREWAWEAFVAINKTARVGSGYSTVVDVGVENDSARGVRWTDMMESFWFAEVLKYSYLVQADDEAPWQVAADGRNTWVWNTEAHPVKVVAAARGREYGETAG